MVLRVQRTLRMKSARAVERYNFRTVEQSREL
jgi:hypothetical protein